jgi:Cu/Ag efflux protein CusF
MENKNIKGITELKAKELEYNSIEGFINNIIMEFDIKDFNVSKTYDYYEKIDVYNFSLSTTEDYKYNYVLDIDFNRNTNKLSLVCSEVKKPETENEKNFIMHRQVNIMNMNEFKMYFTIKDNMKRKNSKLVSENNKLILELLKSKFRGL